MKMLAIAKHHLNNLVAMTTASIVFIALLFLASCDRNELDRDPIDSENASADGQEDFYSEDAEDIALSTFNTEIGGGRTQSSDDRLSCATITRTGTVSAGTITIDFGTGCTDPRGNTRTGKLVLTFNGRWNLPGSSWTLTHQNYTVNDIAVEGTRTVTNITTANDVNMRFSVVVQNGKLTFPDGTVATRSATKTRELELDANDAVVKVTVTGSASGTNRRQRSYEMQIIEPIVFSKACRTDGAFMPVDGVKKVTQGAREITIDYGSGTCDNSVTITNKAGRTWTITVDQ